MGVDAVLLVALLFAWGVWVFFGFAVVLVWSRVGGDAVFPIAASLAMTMVWAAVGGALFAVSRRYARNPPSRSSSP